MYFQHPVVLKRGNGYAIKRIDNLYIWLNCWSYETISVYEIKYDNSNFR